MAYQSLTQIKVPAPLEESHVPRLGDVRPLRLTEAEFYALEDPPGSGLFPSLALHPLVIITDADQGEGIYAESYGPSGVETNTNAVWADGKSVWKITWTLATLTPGLAGAAVGTVPSAVDTLVRIEGACQVGTTSVMLNGSGFSAAVADTGEAYVTGPDGVTVSGLHLTVWYTKA